MLVKSWTLFLLRMHKIATVGIVSDCLRVAIAGNKTLGADGKQVAQGRPREEGAVSRPEKRMERAVAGWGCKLTKDDDHHKQGFVLVCERIHENGGDAQILDLNLVHDFE